MNSGELRIHAEESHGSPDSAGKMTFLDSGHWFVWDPCGIVCAVVTYILIAYGELVVLLVLAPPFPTVGTAISVLIFTTFATLAVISHVKAMITDPVRPSYFFSKQTIMSTPPHYQQQFYKMAFQRFHQSVR